MNMNSRTPKRRFRIGIGIGIGIGFGWIGIFLYVSVYVCILYTVLYCTAVLYYYCNYCKNDFTALIFSYFSFISLSSLLLLLSLSSLQNQQQRSVSTPPKREFPKDRKLAFPLSYLKFSSLFSFKKKENKKKRPTLQ